jgi:hypothetical protein
MNLLPRLLIFSLVCSGAAFAKEGAVDISKLPPAAASFDFAKDIVPILEQGCVKCHGPEKQKGALRLDSREAMLKGGDNGPAITEHKSAESHLIHNVARLDEDTAMPPKKENALTSEQVGKLRAWIDAGAPWPVALASAGETKKADHWAFHPPVRPAVPEGAASAIDAFVSARLRQEKLEPSPEADRATLLVAFPSTSPACRRLRRRSTPLPPTPQRTPTKSRSIGFSPLRATASAGRAGGWMPRATPTAMASRKISRASNGPGATG